MPLSIPLLSNTIFDALGLIENKAKESGATTTETRQLFADEIAKAIVNHLKDNALVTGVCPSGGGALTQGKVL
jgi:hypothetical protein